MIEDSTSNIRTAEVVLPCADLAATLAFFTERLGFRIDGVRPADDPRIATMSAHGLRLRLERGGSGDPGALRLACDNAAAIADGATMLTAPNGTRIELIDADPAPPIPTNRPSLVVRRGAGDADWIVGRAGMRYRDLIPDRQGGRFIASHIQIPEGGPVPDYVHFHKVRFQMIYCYKGWVRVVYEDQGEPFELRAGDCVLQPPQIRHRVLACSPGLEVLEIGCPAEHETCADHELSLPNDRIDPERDFTSQRFVRHVAADAAWIPWQGEGLEFRDTGIAQATTGVAGAVVVRAVPAVPAERPTRTADRHVQRSADPSREFLFYFVLHGDVTVRLPDAPAVPTLHAADSIAIPNGMSHELAAWSDDFELLEVALPPSRTPHHGSQSRATNST